VVVPSETLAAIAKTYGVAVSMILKTVREGIVTKRKARYFLAACLALFATSYASAAGRTGNDLLSDCPSSHDDLKQKTAAEAAAAAICMGYVEGGCRYARIRARHLSA